ncbi:MAG: hypothetical protein H7A52_10420 [Akkermansiaceae bacterium]|nr:hypothetical protein [Akkermansiaceae bacterium]
MSDRSNFWLSLGGAACLAFGVSACGTTGTTGSGGGSSTGARISDVPATFLATDHPRLAGWLEQRFEVNYRNMRPDIVFDQDPLSDIRYQAFNLPENAPLFHLKEESISRRELLHKIAKFWNLDMSLVYEGGSPTHVKVAGR